MQGECTHWKYQVKCCLDDLKVEGADPEDYFLLKMLVEQMLIFRSHPRGCSELGHV